MIDYNAAQHVLRHKQIMKPELVVEAAAIVERIVLTGMIAFAVALPRNPLRPQLDVTHGGQA